MLRTYFRRHHIFQTLQDLEMPQTARNWFTTQGHEGEVTSEDVLTWLEGQFKNGRAPFIHDEVVRAVPFKHRAEESEIARC